MFASVDTLFALALKEDKKILLNAMMNTNSQTVRDFCNMKAITTANLL